MPAFFAYLCNDIERVQMRALSVIAQQVHTANIYLDLIYARLKKVALGCVRNSSPPFRKPRPLKNFNVRTNLFKNTFPARTLFRF